MTRTSSQPSGRHDRDRSSLRLAGLQYPGLTRARSTHDTGQAQEVDHAIATFRARDADVPAKRTAIVTLAGILEANRALPKAQLFRKDEGALFHIANEFDLRHRDASQRADYDPAFVDWVFWTYLATVELVDRLLQRQETQ